MKNLTIFRPHISEYQKGYFEDAEKQIARDFQAKYVRDIKELSQEEEIILITTSQTKSHEIESLVKDYNIQLIIHPNSGYDNFTIDLVSKTTAPIIIGNKIRANAVYHYTVSCLLESLGSIPFRKRWDDARQFSRRLDKKILIYGKGHIGKKLESFLISSELDHTFYDPYIDHHSSNINKEEYDIIILLCSLNRENFQFVNSHFLNNLKSDVVIINPARGGLVHQEHLFSFLNRNKHAFAYLDVFENEPCDLSQFNIENAKFSSHIAGVYDEIDEKIISFEREIIESFLSNDQETFKKLHDHAILKNRIIGDLLI